MILFASFCLISRSNSQAIFTRLNYGENVYFLCNFAFPRNVEPSKTRDLFLSRAFEISNYVNDWSLHLLRVALQVKLRENRELSRLRLWVCVSNLPNAFLSLRYFNLWWISAPTLPICSYPLINNRILRVSFKFLFEILSM